MKKFIHRLGLFPKKQDLFPEGAGQDMQIVREAIAQSTFQVEGANAAHVLEGKEPFDEMVQSMFDEETVEEVQDVNANPNLNSEKSANISNQEKETESPQAVPLKGKVMKSDVSQGHSVKANAIQTSEQRGAQQAIQDEGDKPPVTQEPLKENTAYPLPSKGTSELQKPNENQVPKAAVHVVAGATMPNLRNVPLLTQVQTPDQIQAKLERVMQRVNAKEDYEISAHHHGRDLLKTSIQEKSIDIDLNDATVHRDLTEHAAQQNLNQAAGAIDINLDVNESESLQMQEMRAEQTVSKAIKAETLAIQKQSLFSKETQLKGNLKTSNACIILGEFEGDIDQKVFGNFVLNAPQNFITIGETGVLHGSIHAQAVCVMGRFNGGVIDACGGFVQLYEQSIVSGHIRYAKLQVDAANLNATLERVLQPATLDANNHEENVVVDGSVDSQNLNDQSTTIGNPQGELGAEGGKNLGCDPVSLPMEKLQNLDNIIGQGAQFQGVLQIPANQSIKVDGYLEGDLVFGSGGLVHIGPQAVVRGREICADFVYIEGAVYANIKARCAVEMAATAQVIGDIVYSKDLQIQAGAKVLGRLVLDSCESE